MGPSASVWRWLWHANYIVVPTFNTLQRSGALYTLLSLFVLPQNPYAVPECMSCWLIGSYLLNLILLNWLLWMHVILCLALDWWSHDYWPQLWSKVVGNSCDQCLVGGHSIAWKSSDERTKFWITWLAISKQGFVQQKHGQETITHQK